jgi:putative ABC transport system permease protein
MTWWSDFRERILALVRGERGDHELREEIRTHLEMDVAARMDRGLSEEEARREAERIFGGTAHYYDEARDARGIRPLVDLLFDLRHALRGLRRGPGFAAIAILVLGLGIGANVAIFSAVNAVILRPLPYPEPDRLVALWEANPEKGWSQQVTAPANMLDWGERVRAFDGVAGHLCCGQAVLGGDGEPRVIRGSTVTGNFFTVLGVRPLLGRAFVPRETWAADERVVVLSHRFWQGSFGADAAIVGRSIEIDGVPRRVVGVMGAGVGFPSADLDYWEPTNWAPDDREQRWFRQAHYLNAIARLRSGVDRGRADAELKAVARSLEDEYPATNRAMGAGLTPLHEYLVGKARTPLLVLLASAGFLLLIGCANVGNLLLVKTVGRQREIAVRAALGAGRFRLVRQMMTESLVLSAIGGAVGLGLGLAGTRLLARLQPSGVLPDQAYTVDWRVLAFIGATTVGCGLLFGSIAALWTGRAGAGEGLKEGGRSGSIGRTANRFASWLVVLEVALALLLVTGAGLLVRSFQQLLRVDPGFDPRGVLAVSLTLTDAKYSNDDQVRTFFQELHDRLRSVPGVSEIGATNALPLIETSFTSDFVVAGWPPDRFGTEVTHRTITPGYLAAMRVPLLRGRAISAQDRSGGQPVLLINEALARQHFGAEDPVGRRIAFGRVPDSSTTWYTIVGVVGNERQRGVAEQAPIQVLEPFQQHPTYNLRFVLRSDGDPMALLPAVRRTVAELDRNLPIFDARSMEAVRAESMARERFLMVLLLGFAGVALMLSMVGVYGVVAQFTRQRTRELGVRLALGAAPGDVRRMVVFRGMRLVLAGLVVGLGAALLTTRAMAAMLYNVRPADPLTFAAVGGALLTAGALAAWFPALRAGKLDPGAALRGD